MIIYNILKGIATQKGGRIVCMIMDITSPKSPNGSGKDNVIERFLHLGVVSCTIDSLQNKYVNMKQAHPLVGSVCGFYEKGVQTAGTLAVRSIQPVVKTFEHQISAANEIACKGMDHLESKVPALHFPPDKIAFELKESISATIQHARSGFGSPITNTSDKVLGVASAGFGITVNAMNGAKDYAFSKRLSQMATDTVYVVLYNMEKIVDYMLPQQEECEKPDGMTVQSYESLSLPPSGLLPRIGALASRVFQHTTQWTYKTIEDARNKGQNWLPGSVALSKEPQSLLVSVTRNLQSVYLSAVSSVKKTPSAVWETARGLLLNVPWQGLSFAKDTLATIGGTLLQFKDKVLPNQKVKEKTRKKKTTEKKEQEAPRDSVRQEKSVSFTADKTLKQREKHISLESKDPAVAAAQQLLDAALCKQGTNVKASPSPANDNFYTTASKTD
uniref:Perilipin 1 n=1 Tax=Xenopus tropicalis TaxID=8364 RepID=A0A6I8Q248_XENTR